jgi:phospholipid/cholesterol/gamma-HCH transport system substrate-binding protein
MNKESGSRWKLGMFVMIGLALLATTIYLVGKQKNLFGSTFYLRSEFKTISGLKVGNNIRFSGINIGTVDRIELITDTSVMVGFVIRKKYQRFIKTDARASIGSDGLMGDKVLTILPGIATNNATSKAVNNNDQIASKNAIEMGDVMYSMKTSIDNAAIITTQLAEFSSKMNNGDGALSKLISDKEFAGSLKNTFSNLEASSNQFASFTTKLNNGTLGVALDSTMSNIQSATKGLSENMEAAQHSFLLKGFFKKKKRAEAKKQGDLKKVIEINKKKDAKDSINSIIQ